MWLGVVSVRAEDDVRAATRSGAATVAGVGAAGGASVAAVWAGGAGDDVVGVGRGAGGEACEIVGATSGATDLRAGLPWARVLARRVCRIARGGAREGWVVEADTAPAGMPADAWCGLGAAGARTTVEAGVGVGPGAASGLGCVEISQIGAETEAPSATETAATRDAEVHGSLNFRPLPPESTYEFDRHPA